jgi:outer membrane protein assembly factor BamA
MKTSKNVKLLQEFNTLFFILFFLFSKLTTAQQDSVYDSDVELFPIVNYDSDAGFGYGAKAFIFNQLKINESFDLILYNSTKGERWYRFVFSVMDMQHRQGKPYSLALDVIFDYDKWINYRYYGVEYFNDRDSLMEYETYTREPIEISAIISKGFSKTIVASTGLRYRTISSYNFDPKGELQKFDGSFNNRFINTLSILADVRWDSRNNFINPNRGIVLQIDAEFAPELSFTNENYLKLGLTFQNYLTLFEPQIVFASRLVGQIIFPDNVPIQLQLPIGGNNSLRGLPQDRYLSASTLIINNELRFPIWWRFGGIVGLDIGCTGSTTDYEFWSQQLSGWIINPVLGLRFYMDNFIVRFDVGFGSETTGIYFNFGHIF